MSHVYDGLVLHLHAALANDGLSRGRNTIPTKKWYDLSGKGNHGTLTDFNYLQTSTNGWVGGNTLLDPYALKFNSSAYVTCGSASSLKPTASVTFEAWFYYEGGSIVLDSGVSDSKQGFGIYLNASSELVAEVRTATHTASANLGVKEFGWYHIVGVYDGSNKDFYVYLNGAPESYTLAAESKNDASTYPLTIGRYAHTTGGYLLGRVPVVRVYGRALTGEEVYQNYSAGYNLRDGAGDLVTKMYVIPYAHLEGNLQVNSEAVAKGNYRIIATPAEDLQSSVEVKRHNSIGGSVNINPVVTMQGRYGIIPYPTEDLQSSIKLNVISYLSGSLHITPVYSMSGRYNDPINVGWSDLQGTIEVKRHQSLTSRIVVRDMLLTTGAVVKGRYDILSIDDSLPSSLSVRSVSQLPSRIGVSASGRMSAEYNLFEAYTNDLASRATVKSTNGWLKARVSVVKPVSMSVRYGKVSSIVGADFPSSVNVTAGNNLTSRLSIQSNSIMSARYNALIQVSTSDLAGSITTNNRKADFSGSLKIMPSVKMRGRYSIDGITINEIPASIKLNLQHNLPANIGVFSRTKVTGKYGMRGIEISELPSTVEVKSTSQIKASISVGTRAYMRLRYKIDPIEISELPANMFIRAIRFLPGHMFINAEASMKVRYKISGLYTNDLPTSMSIKRHRNLPSHIAIRPETKLVGKYGVVPRYWNDFPSSFTVKESANLPSLLRVSPYTHMKGIYDLIERPNFTVGLKSVRDSFVRESKPTINYGKAQQMMVGYDPAVKERYRGYVGFDLATIPTVNTEIGKAYLKLFNGYDTKGITKIQILEPTEDWKENSITWANQPYPFKVDWSVPDYSGFVTEAEVDGSQPGYTSFDVTALVKDWYTGKKPNNGFVIRLLNQWGDAVKTFYTKEQIERPPILEVTYYDFQVYSKGYELLPARITVRQSKTSDLKGSLRLNKRYAVAPPLKGHIKVRDPKTLFSYITASRPDTVSLIKVRRKGSSAIDGNVAVRKWSEDDARDSLLASIAVSKPNLISSIYVLYRKDLSGSLKVRRTIPDAYTPAPELAGSLVVSRPDMGTSIKVRQESFSDLPSGLYVQWNMLHSSISVSQRMSLPSNIKVQREAVPFDVPARLTIPYRSDLAASITPTKKALPGHIDVYQFSSHPASIKVKMWAQPNPAYDLRITGYVPHSTYLSGSITVGATSQKKGSIYVRSPYLASNIKVPFNDYVDWDSEIDVRVWGKDDGLRGSLQVTGWRDPATGETVAWLASELNVQRSIVNDLASSIAVQLTDANDHSANLYVVALGESSLSGSITANKYRDYDKFSNIKVRGWAESSLGGSIYVQANSRLPSHMSIWEKSLHEGSIRVQVVINASNPKAPTLPGTISVRRDAYRDLRASIKARQYDVSDLLSSFIGIKQHANLDAHLLVTPWARMTAKYEDFIEIGDSSLPSSLGIREHSNLPGHITLIHHAKMSARYDIKPTGLDDLQGNIYVREVRFLEGNIKVATNGKMTARYGIINSDNSNLPASISVWAFSLLDSHVGVRRWAESNLSSSINVYEHSNLDSHIAVRRWNTSPTTPPQDQLPGHIAARRWGVPSDLKGNIKVRRWDNSDLAGRIAVRRWNYDQLPGIIKVTRHNSLECSIEVLANEGYVFIM